VPDTRYAKSGGVNLAYQVIGNGPVDLVYVAGWVTNIEVMWEEPALAGFLRRLASFSRLVVFDKRGAGLSDPVPLGELPDLETHVADLRAVMDAAGLRRAVLFGHSQGGSVAIAFAAQHPEQVERLVLMGAYAKRLRSPDYPWAPTREERVARAAALERLWDDPTELALHHAPSRASDAAFLQWMARWLRLSASPRGAASLLLASSHIDVTGVLGDVTAPTLLLYRIEDEDVRIDEGRYLAERMPAARLVELHGSDHFFYVGDTEPILAEIEEFVTGHRSAAAPERVVATVLFTDIVGSTDLAATLGDRRWRELIDRHHQAVRSELARWRGREIKTTGDGFLATFTSPAAAIGCADAITDRVRRLGVEVRCGVHAGEVELMGDDVAGLTVHIGARITDLAGAGEILVSGTVRDLVAGTDLRFDSRGRHCLEGVPGEWEILAVRTLEPQRPPGSVTLTDLPPGPIWT